MPIQIRPEFSTAGRKADEIKGFTQPHFQCQQLIPNHQTHPFNKLSTRTDKSNRREQRTPKSDERRPPEIKGMRFHYKRKGHKIAECPTAQREDAAQLQHDRQDAQPERPKCKQKLVCDNCGYTGHPTQDKKRIQPPHTEIFHMTNTTQKKTVDSASTSKNPPTSVPGQRTAWSAWSKHLLSHWIRPRWFSEVSEPRSILRETSSVQTMSYLKNLVGKNSVNGQTQTVDLKHRKDVSGLLPKSLYQRRILPWRKCHTTIITSCTRTVKTQENQSAPPPKNAPAYPQQLEQKLSRATLNRA